MCTSISRVLATVPVIKKKPTDCHNILAISKVCYAIVKLYSGGECEFAGLERWNGILEWSTGLDYWSGRGDVLKHAHNNKNFSL